MPRLTTRLTALLAAAAAAAALLTGCAAAVVGGAAATGALMVTNRRSPSTQVIDQGIELRAATRVSEILDGRGHVNIVSYYRKVLLAGEVPSEEVRQRIQVAVAETPDVIAVVNELAVMPPSSLSGRANDTMVTGLVKTNLLNTKGVPANSIKVVTERGTTYLMGRVTREEADLATEAARTTNGVQRVVRVFDFISEEEARRADGNYSTSPRQQQAPVSSLDDASGRSSSNDDAATGATTHPVTQPVMIKQPPERIDVEQLPPAD